MHTGVLPVQAAFDGCLGLLRPGHQQRKPARLRHDQPRRCKTAARPTTAAPSCRPYIRARRSCGRRSVGGGGGWRRRGGAAGRASATSATRTRRRTRSGCNSTSSNRSTGKPWNADPHNPGVEGAIESFELAFRMQKDLPKVMDISNETAATKALYGIGEQATESFGRQCLLARRFVEAGVRFVEITSPPVGPSPRPEECVSATKPKASTNQSRVCCRTSRHAACCRTHSSSGAASSAARPMRRATMAATTTTKALPCGWRAAA